MSEPLDVLLIESHPGVGDASARVLTESGHRVHRCHQPGDSDWVCIGLTDPSACPVEGHIDSAVLARAPGTTGRTDHEDGVRCAIRAGVPLVEVSADETEEMTSGEYSPWVSLHTHAGALDAACHAAVSLSHQPIVDDILERVTPLIADVGLAAERTRCEVSVRWPMMTVTIVVPGPVDSRLEQAIGVRANDALRGHRGDCSTLNVKVLAGTAIRIST